VGLTTEQRRLEHRHSGCPACSDRPRDVLSLAARGSHIPGVISAGRFYSEGQLVFWDVHNPDNAIAIELRHERHGHLVLEVEDPEADIACVQQAAAGVPA
jgi:hypothetical protein